MRITPLLVIGTSLLLLGWFVTVAFAPPSCLVGQEQVDVNGISACRNCTAETYNINGDGKCRECPAQGARCSGGSRVTSMKNYWLYLDTSGDIRPYSCPDNYCEEGSKCAKFRTGLLCGRCQPGYNQFYLTGGPCVKCDSVDWLFLILIIVGLWILVTVLTIAEMMESTAKVKVIVFFIQTIPLVLGPQFRTSTILNLFNIQAGSSSDTFACLAPLDFYGQFLFNVIVPFAIILYLPINFFISKLVSDLACRYWKPEAIDEENPEKASLPEKLRQFASTPPRKSLYIRSFCAVLLFDYSSIANAVFMFRTCQGVAGMKVLASAPGVSCQTNTYSRWLILATILQVYIALAPVVLLGFLIYLRNTSQLFRTFWLTHIGVFYDAYKIRAFWWECVVLLRRSLTSFLYLTFFNNPGMRTYTLLVACVTMLALHLLALPYRQKFENYGEAYLLFVLCMIAAVQSSDATRVTTSFNGLLIGVIASSVVGILMVATWDYQLKLLQLLEKRQSNLLFTRLVRFLEHYLEEKKRNQPRSLSVFYKWRAQQVDEDLQTEMRLYTGNGAPPLPSAPNPDIRLPLTASMESDTPLMQKADLVPFASAGAPGGTYEPPSLPATAASNSAPLTSSMKEARRKKMPKPAERPPSILYRKLNESQQRLLSAEDANAGAQLQQSSSDLRDQSSEGGLSDISVSNPILRPAPVPYKGYQITAPPATQPPPRIPPPIFVQSSSRSHIEPIELPSHRADHPSSPTRVPVRKPTPPRLAPLSPVGWAVPSTLTRASRLRFIEPPVEVRQSTRRREGANRSRAPTGRLSERPGETASPQSPYQPGYSTSPRPASPQRNKIEGMHLDLKGLQSGTDLPSGRDDPMISPRSKQPLSPRKEAPAFPSRLGAETPLLPVPGSGAPLPARSPYKSALRPSRVGEAPPEEDGGLFSLLREKLVSHIAGLGTAASKDADSGRDSPAPFAVPASQAATSPRPPVPGSGFSPSFLAAPSSPSRTAGSGQQTETSVSGVSAVGPSAPSGSTMKWEMGDTPAVSQIKPSSGGGSSAAIEKEEEEPYDLTSSLPTIIANNEEMKKTM